MLFYWCTKHYATVAAAAVMLWWYCVVNALSLVFLPTIARAQVTVVQLLPNATRRRRQSKELLFLWSTKKYKNCVNTKQNVPVAVVITLYSQLSNSFFRKRIRKEIQIIFQTNEKCHSMLSRLSRTHFIFFFIFASLQKSHKTYHFSLFLLKSIERLGESIRQETYDAGI